MGPRSEEQVGLPALCISESGPGSRLRSPVTLHAPRSQAPPKCELAGRNKSSRVDLWLCSRTLSR